jgi:hypothetical protein
MTNGEHRPLAAGGEGWLDVGERAWPDGPNERFGDPSRPVDLQATSARRIVECDVPEVPAGERLAVGPDDQVLVTPRMIRTDLGFG